MQVRATVQRTTGAFCGRSRGADMGAGVDADAGDVWCGCRRRCGRGRSTDMGAGVDADAGAGAGAGVGADAGVSDGAAVVAAADAGASDAWRSCFLRGCG